MDNGKGKNGLVKGTMGDSIVVFPGGLEAHFMAGKAHLDRDCDCGYLIRQGDIVVRKSGLAFVVTGYIDPDKNDAEGKCILPGYGTSGPVASGESKKFGLTGILVYRPTGRIAGVDFVVSTGNSTTSKETSMIKATVSKLREYVKQHENTIITITILVTIDHFFFEGQMRGKIKAVVERIFDKLLRTLD